MNVPDFSTTTFETLPQMSCSHVTKHGQTWGRIRYACDGVCSKGRLCEKNPGSYEFFTSRKAGPPKGKCGLENSCCCKVRSYISQERKNNNQLVGDKFSVSKDQSIFDHSQKRSLFSCIFVIVMFDHSQTSSKIILRHFLLFVLLRVYVY